MSFARKAIAAACAGFAAAALVGCGGSGSLLSGNQASSLKRDLGKVTAELKAGNCESAQQAVRTFQNRVNDYTDINSTLISNLGQGAHRIAHLAEQSCPAVTTPTVSTQTKTTPTTSTMTTTTTTPPVTTVTSTPVTTATTTQTAPTTTTGASTSTTATSTTTDGGSGIG